MAKPTRDKDGKFTGSIGDGKDKVPTPAPVAAGSSIAAPQDKTVDPAGMLAKLREHVPMTRPLGNAENAILVPQLRGQKVTLPKGAVFSSTRPQGGGILARRQDVTIHNMQAGYVDVYGVLGKGKGYVVLPKLTWVGANSYWMDVQVTPQVADALGIELNLPNLEHLNENEATRLDVEPSFDRGYTDEWLPSPRD